jgi:hypothetical protein
MLVHGANLEQKENHQTKYLDLESREYLKEIRKKYDEWYQANIELIGPKLTLADTDKEIIAQRVQLFGAYKDFIDQQKYAEKFDSRSNLHSSVLEEFLFYLFRDLVNDFGGNALIGKSHTFKDIFFVPPNYKEMTERVNASVERKDHDFVIGATIEARLRVKSQTAPSVDITPRIGELPSLYEPQIDGETEIHNFDIPAVAIECKTYLDKTMLESSSRSAEELKARNPNGLYIIAMEWIKLTDAVNLRKYKVDQIYVFRKQKNTDREFRFDPSYVKNPIDPEVVWHLFETVRSHLAADWKGGIQHGLKRGWLI